MKRIVVIGVYFGKFPEHFDLWLKSCKYNNTIDFKIFTDQKNNSKIKNVEFIHMSMDQFRDLIREKIGKNFILPYPYKCCDYKPVYGIILSDYIKEYDFWGHCDFDLIFGDIRKFINDDLLNHYDKILPLGHLSFYRNTIQNNNRYKDQGSNVGSYKEVFTNPENVAFDETNGIAQIYYKNNYPFYDKRVFADISIIHKRFTLALTDKNYKQQVFYWENGKILKAYEEKNRINTKEYIYIHFKNRKDLKMNMENTDCDSFYISNKGFFKKEKGIPSKKDIMYFNRYPGIIAEVIEKLSFFINQKQGYILKKIKKSLTRKKA